MQGGDTNDPASISDFLGGTLDGRAWGPVDVGPAATTAFGADVCMVTIGVAG